MAMVHSYHFLLLPLVLALPTIEGLKYTVINNARESRGGIIFDAMTGERGAKNSMRAATYFIWDGVFHQQQVSDRKRVGEIRLIIEPQLHRADTYEVHGQGQIILVNARHLDSYVPANYSSLEHRDRIAIDDRVRLKIDLVLTLGVAFALAWTGNGDIPPVLHSGIAAVAVLEAGYKPVDWVKAGAGNKWDDSFDVTAQFFYYINKRKPHFVAELNKKMRISDSDSYFEEAAWMTIDEWWETYKREYAQE